MIDRKFVLLALLALALSLGACGWFGGGGSKSADTANVYCPTPLTVADAQRLTRFKDGPGRDPRDIVFEAALVASGTTCELSRNQLSVNLIMRISVNAGPSVGAGATQVPYFVRVINNSGGVVQGQQFTADFRLTSGNPRGASQEELTLRLPYNEISDLAGYRIAVGLKPTQEELNYNRQATNRP
jgi:hypothetical protein